MPSEPVSVAIVLPGRGYPATGPAMHLPVLAAEEAGYRIHVVSYPPEALAAADLAAVVDDTRRQVEAVLDTGPVERLVVIAKSLGTRVAAALGPTFDRAEAVSVIWLTPLFGEEEVRAAAIDAGWRSLVAVGGVDPYFDAVGTREVVEAIGAVIVELDGADHALEVRGDVVATAAGFQALAGACRSFLGRG